MSITPVLWKLRQEDCLRLQVRLGYSSEFQVSLSHGVRLSQKKKKGAVLIPTREE